MKRTASALLATAVCALLAACTPAAIGLGGGPTGTVTSDSSPAAQDTGTSNPPAGTADPRPVRTPAPRVTPDATLPFSWTDATLVDTGWNQQPQIRDGLFVSFSATDPSDAGPLQFTAIDAYGTVRWRAERPPACTGFAVSTAGETPIVVLTEPRATPAGGRARWQTTASAYNLATGARLWGPVTVPGTVQGPGLVFGASAPAATLGATGPRVALDPHTGRTVADEGATPDLTVVGEYDGTVLLARAGDLVARDAATGATEWVVPSPVGNTPGAPPSPTLVPGAALISRAAGEPAVLIDLADGRTIATDVDHAGYDPLSLTWVWVSGTTLHASSPRHPPWTRVLPAAPDITAAGTGLIYLRYRSTVHVVNAVTGRDAQAYPPAGVTAYALPQHITTDGAALFTAHHRVLLATLERPPR